MCWITGTEIVLIDNCPSGGPVTFSLVRESTFPPDMCGNYCNGQAMCDFDGGNCTFEHPRYTQQFYQTSDPGYTSYNQIQYKSTKNSETPVAAIVVPIVVGIVIVIIVVAIVVHKQTNRLLRKK